MKEFILASNIIVCIVNIRNMLMATENGSTFWISLFFSVFTAYNIISYTKMIINKL